MRARDRSDAEMSHAQKDLKTVQSLNHLRAAGAPGEDQCNRMSHDGQVTSGPVSGVSVARNGTEAKSTSQPANGRVRLRSGVKWNAAETPESGN